MRCKKCTAAIAAEAMALRVQETEQRRRAAPGPHQKVHYYTCRYCGELRVAKVSGTQREVCPARACQLARLAANNLRTRNGVTREDADARMAYVVRRASRQW